MTEAGGKGGSGRPPPLTVTLTAWPPAGHRHHPDQQAQVPQGGGQAHAEGGDPRGGAQRGRGGDRPRRARAAAGPDPVVPRSEPDPDPGTGGSRGGWAGTEMRGRAQIPSSDQPRASAARALSLAERGNVLPPRLLATPTVDFGGRGAPAVGWAGCEGPGEWGVPFRAVGGGWIRAAGRPPGGSSPVRPGWMLEARAGPRFSRPGGQP